MGKRLKILIIDSNPNTAFTTSEVLRKDEFAVTSSSDAAEAIQFAKTDVPHLILLDLLMPDTDGIDICIELKKIETLSNTLMVFFTERTEDYSQIAAFNAGADDYIIKPSKPRVLISRLKALLKRQKINQEFLNKNEDEGLVIDREKYLIFMDGSEIVLPRKQFELLALLYSSPQKVFTRKEIANLIWGYEIFSKNRTIDVHIRKLREKLGDSRIKTIKGIGYSLDV